MNNRPFDLILWGATGYTGKLVAHHLTNYYGVDKSFRWAIGGRNQEKLEQIRSSLGSDAGQLPIVTGDATDPHSMSELTQKTRVVCSTVGPYAVYGSNLVAACAESGTHYCDLTGEVPWIREMIDRHEKKAKKSGARIVFCCGFDSVPSDLGVFFLNEHVLTTTGEPCSRVHNRVTRLKGGISGGTAAGLLLQVEDLRTSPEMRRLLQNPYALNSTGEQDGPDGADPTGPAWDPDLMVWTAPFVMATINTRVVRRSNALMDFRYGRDFSYTETMTTGSGSAGRLRATLLSLGLNSIGGLLSFGPTRFLARKYFLPQSGEGPTEQERKDGYFEYTFIGAIGSRPTKVRCTVGSDADPGYETTSKMLGESAVCLAMDEDQLAVGGGMWTPASAMGKRLIERLEERAGMWFRVLA